MYRYDLPFTMIHRINLFILIGIGFIIDYSNAKLQIETEMTHVMQILHDFDKFYDIYLQDEYYTALMTKNVNSITYRHFQYILTADVVTPFLNSDFKLNDRFFNILMFKSSSVTSLFVTLQVKFLSILHSINFLQCTIFASRFSKYKKLKKSCSITATYLYVFGVIHNEGLIRQITYLLQTVHFKSNKMKKLYKDMRILTTNLVNAFDEKFEKEIIAEAGSISEEDFFEVMKKKTNTLLFREIISINFFFLNIMYACDENIWLEEDEFELSLDSATKIWEIAPQLKRKILEGYPIRTNFQSLAADVIRDISMQLILLQKPDFFKNDIQAQDTFKMGMGLHYFLQIVINVQNEKSENNTEQLSNEEEFSEDFSFLFEENYEESIADPSEKYLRKHSKKSSEELLIMQCGTFDDILSNVCKKSQCHIYYVMLKYSTFAELSETSKNNAAIALAEGKKLITEKVV